MKKSFLTKILLLTGIGILTASTSWATLVTWDLNPGNLNQNGGSSSHTYTVSGFNITASGYDNVAGTDPTHDLFYKFDSPIGGASEHGLGIVGTVDNELGVNTDGSPAQYIQLDLK